MRRVKRKSILPLFALIICVLLIISSCNQGKQEEGSVVAQDSMLPPHVTIFADLSDSLSPQATFLTNTLKPVTISIPIKPGGSYTIQSTSGPKTIKLLPPASHSFIDSITHLPIPVEAQGSAFFTNYTTDNGLAFDGISSAIMDRAGNLWFGTYGGGVSCYDGKLFATFSSSQGLANNTVRSIAEDKSGNLWFGTEGGGVSRYDGKTFRSFSTSQGLAGNEVRCITEDKSGDLWFGTDGDGASRYDGKTFSNFSTAQGLAGNAVRSIKEDRSGNLWFGTYGGVSRYDGKSFVNFNTSNGLPVNAVRCIAEDKSGNLWFGTEGGGVSKYDGKSFFNFTTAQGLAGNSIRCITEDNSGNLWFGTDGGGVSSFNGKAFCNFTTAQGLSNNTVRSITEDKSGNLWFGTDGGGVSRYDGKLFSSFTVAHGLANNLVFSITEDQSKNLWFGTYGGITRYDGKSFINYTTAQGLAGNTVRSILVDKSGNLWVGTYGGGVSCYNGKTFTNYSTAQGLPNNTIRSIAEDKSGNLWFGTDGGGVSCFDGKSFSTYTTEQGLANNTVRSIKEDLSGNLWFGTDGGGVTLFDGKSMTNFTTSQGLANNTIRCINEDEDGNILLGTEQGLSILYKDKLNEISGKVFRNWASIKPLFENITTKNGLPDNFVTQVIQADEDKLYIGTNLGICEMLHGNSDSKGKKWTVGKIFNSLNGFPVKGVTVGQSSLFKDSKGIIWIATGSDKTALVKFDPNAVHRNSSTPTLVIQNIKINNENICWNDLITNSDSSESFKNITEEVSTFGRPLSDAERDSMLHKFKDISFEEITKWYFLPENLQLPHRNNNISFDFNAIETGRNFAVKYQYMLEGYDNEWSPSSNRTTAGFGNMYEGTYSFKLKAQNPEGVWGEPVSYTFKVLPPWYRKWWMYVLYVAVAGSLIEVFIKWRERNLKRENIILEEKVVLRTKQLDERNKLVEEQKKVVEEEKRRSDELLLNILPSEVAEELKATGVTKARDYIEVTVLFTDFKNFTQMSEKLSAQELVNEINYCYSAFDHIITKHGIEKIKTIGDSYMCAGGLPVVNKTNAEDTVRAALEIRDFMLKEKQKRETLGMPYFEIRIGCNTGSVVAGIVGIKKFVYDIWGDTVNIASRMESSGEPGKVNISGNTYAIIKDKFKCEYRGKIEAKNKGLIDMYFVN